MEVTEKGRKLFDLILIIGLVLFFSKGWFKSGLPGHDFPGAVAWLWYIKKALLEWQKIPYWSPYWFNGGLFCLDHPQPPLLSFHSSFHPLL